MDHIEYRTCSVCKASDVVWKNGNFVLFHYSTRRYAHANCMVAKWGLAESLKLIKHAWRIKLFHKALKTSEIWKAKKAIVTK